MERILSAIDIARLFACSKSIVCDLNVSKKQQRVMSQSDPEPDVSKMVLPGGTLSALLTHPVHKTLEAPQTPDIKKMEFVLEDKQPDSADVKILTPKTTHPMKAHATHIDTHINGEGHGHPGNSILLRFKCLFNDFVHITARRQKSSSFNFNTAFPLKSFL